MNLIKQSSSTYHIVFFMTDSADHITGKTGLSPTVTLSKNAAAFAACSGTVTEISSGWYKLAANSTDSNTLGLLALHATATGADATDMIVGLVVPWDPQDSVRLGITALPNVAAGSNGGLPLGDASARVDVGKLLGTTQTAADLGLRALALGTPLTGTFRSGSSSNTAALAAGTIVRVGDTIRQTNGTYINDVLVVGSISDNGGAQPLATAPTGQAWQLGTPTNTVTYIIEPGNGMSIATIADVWTYTTRQLSSDGVQAIFNAAMTESYASLGAQPTLAQALYAMMQMMQNAQTNGTTMTVFKLDGVTPALTLTLNSAYPAQLPTSIARQS